MFYFLKYCYIVFQNGCSIFHSYHQYMRIPCMGCSISVWALDTIFFKFLFIDERETLICYSTYLCMHWLLLICALTRDQTCNFGTSGWCSNQLSYLARPVLSIFLSLLKILATLLAVWHLIVIFTFISLIVMLSILSWAIAHSHNFFGELSF